MKKALFIQLSPCICNIIQILEASPLETSLLEKLTIAIPVYNDEKYIRHAVESCLGQAGKIVIYDNASTDNTSQICSALAAQHPAVKYVRHPENIGAFGNFKSGLFDCQTEYFCWVGSHDLLDAGYSLPILRAMEANKHISIGAGTIVYIDEDGRKTGQVTKTVWAKETTGRSAIDRAGLCATKIKDCFLFYSIHRTASAKAAWFDEACLGFDRAFICKMAAEGEFFYEPTASFFARDFVKTRKAQDTNARRIKDIGGSKAAEIRKDLCQRNKTMIQTILALAENDQELRLALWYIDKINRRYVSRKKYQRRRLALIFFSVLIVTCISLLWLAKLC